MQHRTQHEGFEYDMLPSCPADAGQDTVRQLPREVILPVGKRPRRRQKHALDVRNGEVSRSDGVVPGNIGDGDRSTRRDFMFRSQDIGHELQSRHVVAYGFHVQFGQDFFAEVRISGQTSGP